MGRYFITATDTEVGKTYFSSRFASELNHMGRQVAALKPVSCGDRDDAKILFSATSSGLSLNEINPVHFTLPAAPARAGKLDFAELVANIRAMESRFEDLVVEGIGGWLVPLTETQTVEDLAKELGYTVILVAGNRLGVLNHTLLTAARIQTTGLPFAGVVLNQTHNSTDDLDNAGMLAQILEDRFLGTLPFAAQTLPEKLRLSLLPHLA